MDIFKNPELLENYLVNHSSAEDPVLTELARHTYLNQAHPRMLSGHIMGSFLTLISRLISPVNILEIGTFTGYSAICLARGLRPGGTLTTIEINDELRNTTAHFFEKAGLLDQINLVNGNALEIIPSLQASYDLVFIDAGKDDYPAYYDLIFDKVKKGGYILVDNTLWGGKVLENNSADFTTDTIHQFNKMVTEDQRVNNVLLPIRDGLMVINKL